MSAEPRDLARAARRWLSLADEHLVLARHAFVLKSAIPYRLIAFHAQQCAEAALKAYLVSGMSSSRSPTTSLAFVRCAPSTATGLKLFVTLRS